MDTTELVTLLKNRDRRAIAALYDTYAGALYGIIFRIVPSEAKAEALLESTLLTVWETIDNYPAHHTSFFTWMTALARSLANKYKATGATTPAPAAVPATPGTKHIDALTTGMDKTSLEILNRVYFQGISMAEAAVLLQVPVDTVRVKLKVALTHVQSKLAAGAWHTLVWLFMALSLLF